MNFDEVVKIFYENNHSGSLKVDDLILNKFKSEEYSRLKILIESDPSIMGETGSERPSVSFSKEIERVQTETFFFKSELFCYVSLILPGFSVFELNTVMVFRETEQDSLYFPRIKTVFDSGFNKNWHKEFLVLIKNYFPQFKYLPISGLLQFIPHPVNIFNVPKPQYFDAIMGVGVFNEQEKIIGNDFLYADIFNGF